MKKSIIIIYLIALSQGIFGQVLKINLEQISEQGWQFVWDITYDQDSVLWATCANGKLYYKKNNEAKFKAFNSPNTGGNELRNVLAIDSTDIWVTTDENGIYHFNGITWKNFTTTDGLPTNDGWRQLAKDVNGAIWVINYADGGLVKYNGSSWQKYTKSNSILNSNYLDDILVSKDGTIWIAISEQIIRIKNNQWSEYDLEDEFGYLTWANQLYEDKNGVIWIASRKGLIAFENGTFVSKRNISGEIDIQAVAVDKNNTIWFEELFEGLHRYSSGVKTFFNEDTNVNMPTQCWKILINSKNEKLAIGNQGANLIKINDDDFFVSDKDIELANGLTFSNPSSGYIAISFEGLIKEVSIFDLRGDRVFHNSDYHQDKINIENTFTDGLYYILVNNKISKPIILMR